MGIFSNLSSGKKWGLGCGLAFLICCGGVGTAVLQVVDFPVVANRADSVARDYKAAGLPWEQGDLRTKLPDGENSAALFAMITAENEEQLGKDINVIATSIREKNWKKAKQAIKPKAKITAALRQASLKQGFDFNRDWDQGARLLFPEYAQMKSGVKLLCYEAQIAAQEGNLELALLDVRAGYQMGNLVSREPTLLAMLVGIACQSISIDAALRVAAVRKDDSVWVRRVREEIERWKFELDFGRAMEGEAYFGLATIRNLKGNPVSAVKELTSGDETGDAGLNDDAHLVRTGLPKGMIKTAFAVRHMEAHMHIRKLLAESKGDLIGFGKKFDVYVEGLDDPPMKTSQMLNFILFPVFTQATVAYELGPFRLEAARGVLMAQEYRLRKGVFPSGFDDLGFEVEDPVLKSRAWYKVVGDEVWIYSVGNNGVDDGGDRQKTSSGDDLALRFPPRSLK